MQPCSPGGAEFPREAIRRAPTRQVKARMTLDGTGEVTRVEILEASPRGSSIAPS